MQLKQRARRSRARKLLLMLFAMTLVLAFFAVSTYAQTGSFPNNFPGAGPPPPQTFFDNLWGAIKILFLMLFGL
jgi:hypothetical protein